MNNKILVVEDEPQIANFIKRGLRHEGYNVIVAPDGETGLDMAFGELPDLIILDIMLPGIDGLTVCRQIREGELQTPVLMLTAKDAVPDRVAGLEAGADDYLVKPFDLTELLARIRALLRRQTGRAQDFIENGALRLDPVTHTVDYRGQPVLLSAREFALLRALLETPGAVLSREQLEDRLYGWGEEVESNAVEVHIHHLRRKLSTGIIRTVRGIGYRLGETI